MKFTLYDYLVTYQYKIIEALKKGFPAKSDYNDWIYNEILCHLIEQVDYEDYNYSIFEPGVYVLDNYYIGKTSKPIILRIISHLFETIPTPQTDITMMNYEKILCTKINLLLDNKISVYILSDNPDDEKELIEENDNDSCDYILMNKQYIRNRKTHLDYFKHTFVIDGFCNKYGTPQELYNKLIPLFTIGLEANLLESYIEGFKDREKDLQKREV